MSGGFEVIPAIDLLGGRCVRLTQGRYEDVTVYDPDPAAVAERFAAHAALRRIHVVFSLKDVAPEQAESAYRAHEVFKIRCPVYRSLYRAIDITTELKVEPPPRL